MICSICHKDVLDKDHSVRACGAVLVFDNAMLSRYVAYTPYDQRPENLYAELRTLLVRLDSAEQVILDAEANLGVVNPLLVNSWRESAGMPETNL